MAATVVQVYIGDSSARDKICSGALAGTEKGKRSDRIKDLMLKGLIYEGREVPVDLLDMRYLHRVVMENIPAVVTEIDAAVSNAKEPEIKKPEAKITPEPDVNTDQKERSKVLVERSGLSNYMPPQYPKLAECGMPKRPLPEQDDVQSSPNQAAISMARSIVRETFPAAFEDKPDLSRIKMAKRQVSDDELERRL